MRVPDRFKEVWRERPWLREVVSVAAVLLVAFTVRLVYWLQLRDTVFCGAVVGADVMEYDRWAREMLSEGLLWDRLHIHAPLYPMVLSFLYRATGVDVCLVRGLQLGLDVASAAVFYVALRLLWGRVTGFTGGLLWAFYQPLIYYSGELFCEGLTVFLVVVSLAAWACAWRAAADRWPAWVSWAGVGVAGAATGLAAATHPLSLPFGVGFALLGPWLVFREQPRRRRRLGMALALAGLLVPVAGVAARNIWVSGEPVLIQAREGFNFYLGNNPEATGTCYLRPGPAYEALVSWPQREGIVGEAAARRFFYARSLAFIADRPLAWLGLLLRKFAYTWHAGEIPSGPDLGAVRYATGFMRLPLLRFGLVAPLAFAGMWYVRRDRRLWPFIWLGLAYTAALTLFVTSGRYRIVMMPGVLACTVMGLWGFADAWCRNSTPRAAAGAVAVALGGLLACLPRAPAMPSAAREAILLRAEAAWQTGALAEADRVLVQGIQSYPDDAAMLHLAGAVLADQGKTEAALDFYRRSLRVDPADAATVVDIAVALSESGDTQTARALLEEVLRRQPDAAKAWYNLGVLAEACDDLAEARRCYRRALAADATFVSAILNLGLALHRGGDGGEARQYYRQVIALDPDNSKALLGLAVYHADAGQVDEAVPYFEQAVAAAPKRMDIWEVYARVLATAGRAEAAREVERRGRDAARLDRLPARGSAPGRRRE